MKSWLVAGLALTACAVMVVLWLADRDPSSASRRMDDAASAERVAELETEIEKLRDKLVRLDDSEPALSDSHSLEAPAALQSPAPREHVRSPATPPAASSPDEYLDAYIASVRARKESRHYRLLVAAYVVELLPRIASLAQDPRSDSSLRGRLIEILGDSQLRRHPVAIDALLAILPTDTEEHVIALTLASLRAIGDARAVPALERSVWSLETAELQRAAIAVLASLADDRVHESLRRLLVSAPDDPARSSVLFYLDPDRAIEALPVFELAARLAPGPRLQAAHKIRAFYDPDVVEFIPRWLSFETDRTVRAVLESARQKPGEVPSWHARQATGAPDADPNRDHPKAWASAEGDMGEQWLELDYMPARRCHTVRIYEVNSAGAVVRVEATDEAGEVHTLWSGVDPTQAPGVFEIRMPPTSFAVRRLRVVLDTDLRPGWNEIDCVELSGPDGSAWASEARASSSYAGG